MEKSDKILSIIIPTYNRAEMLLYTLSFFKEQIQRNQDKVELIVCNNVSTDNTKTILEEYYAQHPFFNIVNYTEHVDVGSSIVRSIENATGKYFLVYGDDDIPAPFMVDYLINLFEKYPEIGYLCFNRLRGNTISETNGISGLFLAGKQTIDNIDTYYSSIKDFVNEHQNEVGFISVNAVLREAWSARYKDVYPNNHVGYEFIVPYLYSVQGYPALYVQYPLCVHRDNIHNWKSKAFLYTYLGRPRSIAKQGELGIVDNWKEQFQVYQNRYSDKQFVDAMFSIVSIDKKCADYADEMCSYQQSNFRKKAIQRIFRGTGLKFKLIRLYYKMRLDGFSYIVRKAKKLFGE